MVISNEDMVPYDRTKLSKALSRGKPEQWALRSPEYLQKYDIEYALKTEVTKVDPT
jgi:NAD(P)H-nitrite reductase large subunit